MSASAKLKALSFWQWRRVIREVVAVVEAAEAEVANAQLICDEEILLDRALAALEKKLS